jgi:hypothetical protein
VFSVSREFVRLTLRAKRALVSFDESFHREQPSV